MIRIALVDDHALFRRGLRLLLESHPDFEVVADAASGEEFLAEVRDDEFQPITEIIDRCKEKGLRVGVYTIDGECFVDIGQLNDLKAAEEKIS